MSQTVLWNKEIDQIKESGYLNKNISVTDALIENFYNEILANEEKLLLKLIFSNNPSQEELDNLLKVWDIEVKQGSKSLLLAHFLKTQPARVLGNIYRENNQFISYILLQIFFRF